MGKRFLALIPAMLLLLAGCHGQGQGEAIPVVTSIAVCKGERVCLYTEEAQMRPILNGLRLIGHRYRPEIDPETLPDPEWAITVRRSDGSSQCYHIKSGAYIRQGMGMWEQADRQRLEELTELLSSL